MRSEKMKMRDDKSMIDYRIGNVTEEEEGIHFSLMRRRRRRQDANILEITRDIRLCGGEKVGPAVLGYYIICGNLKIMFNCSAFSREYVRNVCNNIINRYNKELNEIEIKEIINFINLEAHQIIFYIFIFFF